MARDGDANRTERDEQGQVRRFTSGQMRDQSGQRPATGGAESLRDQPAQGSGMSTGSPATAGNMTPVDSQGQQDTTVSAMSSASQASGAQPAQGASSATYSTAPTAYDTAFQEASTPSVPSGGMMDFPEVEEQSSSWVRPVLIGAGVLTPLVVLLVPGARKAVMGTVQGGAEQVAETTQRGTKQVGGTLRRGKQRVAQQVEEVQETRRREVEREQRRRAQQYQQLLGTVERLQEELEKREKRQNRGLFSSLRPFLLGGLTSAGAALLYAPQTGTETRQKLMQSTGQLQESATQALGQAKEQAQQVTGQVKQQAGQVAGQAKEQAQQVTEQTKGQAQQVAGRVRQATTQTTEQASASTTADQGGATVQRVTATPAVNVQNTSSNKPLNHTTNKPQG
jgi:gas vesicle protein